MSMAVSLVYDGGKRKSYFVSETNTGSVELNALAMWPILRFYPSPNAMTFGR